MVQKFKPASSAFIDKQGRIVIPAELRRELGVQCGDKVLMRVKDGELRVYTLDHAIKQVQARNRALFGENPGIVDEFIADRRREFAQEDQELGD